MPSINTDCISLVNTRLMRSVNTDDNIALITNSVHSAMALGFPIV
jgi:hypothetical protein